MYVHITNPQIGIHTIAAEINGTCLVSVNKDLQPSQVIDEIETLTNGWTTGMVIDGRNSQ